MLTTALFLACCLPQDPDSPPIRAALVPGPIPISRGLRWSPKAASVALTARDGGLDGSFALGTAGARPVAVRLERSPGAAQFDRLSIDADRDGTFGEGETSTTSPREQRGKWWSSFEATVAVTIPDPDQPDAEPRSRPYPMALWFVFDPQEPDAAPALRWSRRGWHEGVAKLGERDLHVLVTEAHMDGIFDQRDSWALAHDHDALLRAPSGSLGGHVWLDGRAYRALEIDPHGRGLVFEAFDPGFTEAEEIERNDRTAADRAAPRAAEPLAFESDLTAALARALREDKRVLIDFVTTWCGPCQAMDRMVYTAQPVVDAARGTIAVKVDGDDQRALVKRYGVGGYPTLIVLDPDGTEVRRAVGYRGVAEMVELLRR
jgi:thiol-disulfide isomerase/thioredoxin